MGAARATELEAALSAAGAPRLHSAPYLNEFAVRVPNAAAIHRRLLGRGVLAGLVLSEAEPGDASLADSLLVCATEVTTHREIELFATALCEEIERGRQLALPGISDDAGAAI
jgi:glycine cleavage system pyridoxal-binding protein P